MDGAERAFAVPVEAEFCGKKYVLRGRMAKHYGEIARKILSMRPDPVVMGHAAFEAATTDVEKEMQARIYAELAMQSRFVTRQELYNFINNTIEGTAFVLYLAMKDDQPDITEEQALLIMLEDMEERVYKMMEAGAAEDDARAKAERETQQYIEERVNTAGGEDWRGNSIGSPPTQPAMVASREDTNTSPLTGG